MTVELVRRLLEGELLDPNLIEAALLAAVSRRVSVIRTLVEGSPGLLLPLDRELSRIGVATVERVLPHPELTRPLPSDLCWRLLAVPLRRDVRTGVVQVAAADPLDPHVADELAYHLGSPAAVVRAPLAELFKLLDRPPYAPSEASMRELVDTAEHEDVPLGPWSRQSSGPVSSGRAVTGRPDARTSEPPIPLVRRSQFPAFDGFTRPGVGSGRPPPQSGGVDADGQPVIALWRSKAAPAAQEDQADIGSALDVLKRAREPAEVVRALLGGLSSAALKLAIFAVHSGVFQGREANEAVGGAEAARAVSVKSTPEGVLDVAVRNGHFIGRIPETPGNAPLARLLGASLGDVYIVPVDVSGKPALIIVLGSMKTTSLASQRADRLAKAAGAALERIVRAKKGLR